MFLFTSPFGEGVRRTEEVGEGWGEVGLGAD